MHISCVSPYLLFFSCVKYLIVIIIRSRVASWLGVALRVPTVQVSTSVFVSSCTLRSILFNLRLIMSFIYLSHITKGLRLLVLNVFWYCYTHRRARSDKHQLRPCRNHRDSHICRFCDTVTFSVIIVHSMQWRTQALGVGNLPFVGKKLNFVEKNLSKNDQNKRRQDLIFLLNSSFTNSFKISR